MSEESPTRRRTRTAIVRAAVSVLARRPEASLADIAAEAQVSRSTLHRHFADRVDLERAAVTHSVEDITRATVDAQPEQDQPLVALTRVIAAYVSVGDRIRFLFQDPRVLGAHPDLADFAAADGPVLALIERGQGDGSIDSAVSAAWIEQALWALVYAAAEAVDDGLLPGHAAADTVVRTLVNGIAGSRAREAD